VRALIEAVPARIRCLHLGANDLSDEDVAPLFEGPTCADLEDLRLGSNRLGDPSAVRLAAARFVPTLCVLDLFDNRIGDDGASALGHAPFSRLSRLRLDDNPIQPALRARVERGGPWPG
jgi:hypothetical protein